MAMTKDIQTALEGRSVPVPMPAGPATPSERRGTMTATTPVRFAPGLAEFKDRRRRRRVNVQPMYTSASVRVLSRQEGPLEGYITNLSETGMVVEVDDMIPVGAPVTVEFCVSGLGRLRNEEWPTYAVAAEVVRLDDVSDFPQGPYKTALRFVRIPTMAQAQIARYIATHQDARALV